MSLPQERCTAEQVFANALARLTNPACEEKCYDPRSCPRPGERPRLAEGGACAPLREAWKSVAARVSVTSVGRDADASEIARDADAASP